ncbi:MAG TPA: hypothetical protein VJU16_05185 [Planctomycetota bacterium]|nr:hypothetical protein [Planctomycetota bacterium]
MIVATLALIVLFQEPAAWAKFEPGSWAEHLTTGKRDGAAVRTVEKSHYKDATPTEVIISLETVEAGGGSSVVDMKYPIPQREVPKEDPGKKTGDEKLTLDGRDFACEILEKRGVRRWVCAAATVNGGVLKSEAISGPIQILVRVLKLDDKIKVGKDTLSCWVREEITDTGDQKTTRTTWMSDEVPGGVVRSDVRQVRGKDVLVETTTTLTGFSAVKKK